MLNGEPARIVASVKGNELKILRGIASYFNVIVLILLTVGQIERIRSHVILCWEAFLVWEKNIPFWNLSDANKD